MVYWNKTISGRFCCQTNGKILYRLFSYKRTARPGVELTRSGCTKMVVALKPGNK